jgi:hypothetical protein
VSKPSDVEILNAIAQNRGASVLPQIHYRQMLALESIAGNLAKLANPPMAVDSGEVSLDELKPGPIEYVGPATIHRRRRGAPESP